MDLKRKLGSRKFWMAVAAFFASVGTSIAGLGTGNEGIATVGIVCTVASAAIYAAAEAYVDGKSVPSESTVTTLTGRAAAQKKDGEE